MLSPLFPWSFYFFRGQLKMGKVDLRLQIIYSDYLNSQFLWGRRPKRRNFRRLLPASRATLGARVSTPIYSIRSALWLGALSLNWELSFLSSRKVLMDAVM